MEPAGPPQGRSPERAARGWSGEPAGLRILNLAYTPRMLRTSTPAPARLSGPSGLTIAFNANGSVHRIDHGNTTLNLFPGSEIEGGVANLYLRRHETPDTAVALLGPGSPLRFAIEHDGLRAEGGVGALRVTLACALATDAAAWFWHLEIENTGATPAALDLVHVQDLALAPYATLRLNEHYVSHYLDHTPLAHARCGWAIATRQNLPADGRHPWLLIGSLRRAIAFATDALQFDGLARRCGAAPIGLTAGLPGRRLQHEHALVALQDAPLQLAPGALARAGFFGLFVPDHPQATTPDDLTEVDRVVNLPQAQRPPARSAAGGPAVPATLFSPPRLLPARELTEREVATEFGRQRYDSEHDADGRLLSFFVGSDRHVVLRAKELRVLRPHGHMLRTGPRLEPDEDALTSTVWMSGMFHSLVTQGHVSLNRLLSGVRGYLSQFRAHGQRVFVEIDGRWRLLDQPSAFEMAPDACRWLYLHDGGRIDVRSRALAASNELRLDITIAAGGPARLLICHHVAVDGDDGSQPRAVRYWRDGDDVLIEPAADSALATAYPGGRFRIAPDAGTAFVQVSDDAPLFADGRSRGLPYLCLVTAPVHCAGLRLRGELRRGAAAAAQAVPQTLALPLLAPATPDGADAGRLARIVPWFAHDALIHWLAPRGLEQYSGGGWGTRDVCQGPVEMLLALGHTDQVRATLLRVFAAQDAAGDWPQWFTFFDRYRAIRAGDSHGDIVFWPVLALAEYLLATGEAALLEETVPFYAADPQRAESATVWQHVERALALIAARRIAGTPLAAYGHGDWNDALQPADPSLRERMCSAWTVTLHGQMLTALAAALRLVGRPAAAGALERQKQAVRAAFQQRLVVDEVIAGYALFDRAGGTDYLLHPRDRHTGVGYSLLPMIHAIINDLLDPAQARAHLALIERHLLGPDGARLFDRPLPYQGGLQRLFQRGESAAFFGREIGLMYTHAHLRYAEALAHVGDARGFFDALCRANPIGLRERVPAATLRQANCYYSSSDAAFADRAEAAAGYGRIAAGQVPLDGGWRIYSSGPGIFIGLLVRGLLGLRRGAEALTVDPVLPATLDGLRATVRLAGSELQIEYRVGPRGHGPQALTLNGAALPFERQSNPHRHGGAVVDLETLRARLTGTADRLRVELA